MLFSVYQNLREVNLEVESLWQIGPLQGLGLLVLVLAVLVQSKVGSLRVKGLKSRQTDNQCA